MEVDVMYDLVVIGGGPAGATAAIAAKRRGMHVLLLEAGLYPRHKVCGEFLSAEAACVLSQLLGEDASQFLNRALRIVEARLFWRRKQATFAIEPNAYSVPRLALDHYLWLAAAARGVDCRCQTVKSAQRQASGIFCVRCGDSTYSARSIINASGRWSNLSQRKRDDAADAWIGLKAHFRTTLDPAVYLFFFAGGYCGVQSVCDGTANVCALVRRSVARNLPDVFAADQDLQKFCGSWSQITETFATAPVYALNPEPVREGIWQVGDAAGFVHPFLGDGMSLAIRSGFLAGSLVPSADESADDSVYAHAYHQAFSAVFRAARYMESATTSDILMSLGLRVLKNRAVATWVVRHTRQ